MPSKLYVGNLAYAVTNEDLMELFAQVGTVEKAVVVTDKFSGQSRGFGFVEMADQDGATKAIETLNETGSQGTSASRLIRRAMAAGLAVEAVVAVSVAAAVRAAAVVAASAVAIATAADRAGVAEAAAATAGKP